MIVIVSRGGLILGADNAAVASVSSPRAADWINHIHPDDRLAAKHVLDHSGAIHVETAVIRSAWPRIGYHRARCAAVAIDGFVMLELFALDDGHAHQFKETEAVVVSVARHAHDDLLGQAAVPIYRSMLVGALRTNLPDFHATRGAEVALLSHDQPCTDVIPLHPVLARRARLEAHIGSRHIEATGRVTTVSLRHHAIEYRTDSAPAVILPRSNRQP